LEDANAIRRPSGWPDRSLRPSPGHQRGPTYTALIKSVQKVVRYLRQRLGVSLPTVSGVYSLPLDLGANGGDSPAHNSQARPSSGFVAHPLNPPLTRDIAL
jgi:hypothetical protein